MNFTKIKPTAPLGTLKLPMPFGKHYTVTGGSFHHFNPKHYVGVKMAREIDKFTDIDIPTQDFKTPPQELMEDGLERAIFSITLGHPLYVGCMGGRGRTGLFLAVLAKAWGVKSPVEYVRANYYPHAVETPAQYAYVMNFPINKDIKRMVRNAKIKSLFRRKKGLTNLWNVE